MLVPVASAQTIVAPLIPASGMIGRCSFITGDIHFDCIPLYVGYIIQGIFGLLGTICLLMIIWAGYEWMIAGLQGDTSGAKKRLTNALLGLALSVFSFLIVDTIVSVLFSGPTQ
jgi:hypothetical protein